VVPCYNEAARLEVPRFLEFAGASRDVGLLFVDDGSTDRTSEVLTGLVREVPHRIRAIRLGENQGKAGAVRAGMLVALAGEPVFVGFWDADLATPLPAVERFVTALDAHPELVGAIGARVRLLGTSIERSAVRHYLGRVFATCASIVLRLAVYDTQCGAKLFRNGPLLRAAIGMPFRSRWAFDVELLARLQQAALRRGPRSADDLVIELPLEEWHDVRGSKLAPHAMLRAGLDLAFIRGNARRDVGRNVPAPGFAWL
jgi:dolichyl-phosphate beta-glucosyltransferase